MTTSDNDTTGTTGRSGAEHAAPADATSEQSEITTTYTVAGMTCEHCVSAVRTEIGRLAGVSDVRVDLQTGAVTVTSGGPLPHPQVAEAVDEAGYELTAAGNAEPVR